MPTENEAPEKHDTENKSRKKLTKRNTTQENIRKRKKDTLDTPRDPGRIRCQRGKRSKNDTDKTRGDKTLR